MGGHAAGFSHQRGSASTTGEGHHQHRGLIARGAVCNSAGNGLLEQLTIANWPSGPAMELPLGWHHRGRPAQLLGRPINGGISAAGTAMEEQMHQPAAGASQQLSGDALLGPGQITTAPGRDHKRMGWGHCGPRRNTKIHESAARGDN